MLDGKRVLIVEDDPIQRDAYVAEIERLGAEVDSAGDLPSAKARCDERTFHVAIVDIALVPDDYANVDGLDVMRHIRNLGEGTSVLALSGQPKTHVAREALKEFNAFDYLSKELVIEQGMQVIRDAAIAAANAAELRLYAPVSDPLTFLAGADPAKEATWVGACLEMWHPKGGYQGLRKFFSRLCDPLAPLLPRTGAEHFTVVDRDGRALTGEFWSKGKGLAVVLLALPQDSAEAVLGRGGSKAWAQKAPIHEVVEAGLKGFAFPLPGVARRDFGSRR